MVKTIFASSSYNHQASLVYRNSTDGRLIYTLFCLIVTPNYYNSWTSAKANETNLFVFVPFILFVSLPLLFGRVDQPLSKSTNKQDQTSMPSC